MKLWIKLIQDFIECYQKYDWQGWDRELGRASLKNNALNAEMSWVLKYKLLIRVKRLMQNELTSILAISKSQAAQFLWFIMRASIYPC